MSPRVPPPHGGVCGAPDGKGGGWGSPRPNEDPRRGTVPCRAAAGTPVPQGDRGDPAGCALQRSRFLFPQGGCSGAVRAARGAGPYGKDRSAQGRGWDTALGGHKVPEGLQHAVSPLSPASVPFLTPFCRPQSLGPCQPQGSPRRPRHRPLPPPPPPPPHHSPWPLPPPAVKVTAGPAGCPLLPVPAGSPPLARRWSRCHLGLSPGQRVWGIRRASRALRVSAPPQTRPLRPLRKGLGRSHGVTGRVTHGDTRPRLRAGAALRVPPFLSSFLGHHPLWKPPRATSTGKPGSGVGGGQGEQMARRTVTIPRPVAVVGTSWPGVRAARRGHGGARAGTVVAPAQVEPAWGGARCPSAPGAGRQHAAPPQK